MTRWLHQQWRDVKGNVKFELVLKLGTTALAAIVAATHRLSFWEQLVLTVSGLVLFGLAIAASASRKNDAGQPTNSPAQVHPKDAPQLLMEYKSSDRAARDLERIVFINDGPATLKNPNCGQLRWDFALRREIEVLQNVGPVRPGERVECRIIVVEKQGNSTSSQGDLTHVMRSFMAKYAPELQPKVDVTYEDMNGRRFTRTFLLSIDPYDNVIWDPGPINEF